MRNYVLIISLVFIWWTHPIISFADYSMGHASAKDSINTYLDSARAQSYSNQLSAINLVNRAIELSILTNNSWGEATGYLLLGQIQLSMNHSNLALDNFSRSVAAFLKMPNKSAYHTSQLCLAMVESCTILHDSKRHQEILQKLDNLPPSLWQSLSFSDRNKLLRISARAKALLGSYNEANILLENMIQEMLNAGDEAGRCETLIALGELRLLQNQKDKAESCFVEAKVIAEKLGYGEGVNRANTALANFYSKNQDLDRELSHRNATLEYNRSNNDLQAISNENYNIGNAYFSQGNLAEAENYYNLFVEPVPPILTEQPALENSEQRIQLTPLQYRSTQLQQGSTGFRQLAESYFKKNDLQKALDNFRKYTQLQDSLQIIHQRELEEAIAISNNLGKNEERISLLEKERILSNKSLEILQQDKSLQQEKLLNRNLTIGVLAFLLVFVTGGGAFLIRNIRARRRSDKLLALQSLSGQMNPHFIFNALNSVNEYITLNDERSANRYLSEFSKLMRRVMDDSKHSFIPLQEEIEMLRIYLQLEHARFKSLFNYELDIEESLQFSEMEIPPMIIQPYLENAIWHGLRYRNGEGMLKIKFQDMHGVLHVIIEDNGIGIAKSKELKTRNQKKQNSLGMKNIQTRVSLMNEIYKRKIEINIGELHPNDAFPGTRVELFIPQPQDNQNENA